MCASRSTCHANRVCTIVNTCAAVTDCRYNCTLIGWENGSSRGYSSINIHYVSLIICRFCSHFMIVQTKVSVQLDAARRPLQTFERAMIRLSVSLFQRDETRLRRPCAEDSRRVCHPVWNPRPGVTSGHMANHWQDMCKALQERRRLRGAHISSAHIASDNLDSRIVPAY
jgi:hypothetical protein